MVASMPAIHDSHTFKHCRLQGLKNHRSFLTSQVRPAKLEIACRNAHIAGLEHSLQQLTEVLALQVAGSCVPF
jgi:hypothetical protein